MEMQDSGTRSFLPPCRVCGDMAAGFHYGVNTCEACKGFFHRSLRRHMDYKCRANRIFGYCQYKPGKRKSCQFCRYQRCLQAGMSRDAIKTGRYTYLKKTEDTREIKRLLELEYQLTYNTNNDSNDLLTSPWSSLFTSSAPVAFDLAEMEEKIYDKNILVEADSVTQDKFDRFFGSESDHNDLDGCISGINPLLSSDSFTFERKRKQTPDKETNNCYGKRARIQKYKPYPLQVSLKPLFQDNAIRPNQSSCSMFDLSVTTDSPSPQHNSSSRLYTSDLRLSLNKERSSLTRHKLLAVPDHRTQFRNSAVYHVLRDAEAISTEDRGERNKTDKYEVTSRIRKMKPESGSEILTATAFDLFPDISFCLNGQSATGPFSFRSDDFDSSSPLESSGLCSSVSSHSDSSSNDSSRLTITDLDNGMRFKVEEDEKTGADLCYTPELSHPVYEQISPYNTEAGATVQVIKEYTKDLDLIAEGRCHTQASSPVQTLSTSHPPDLGSDIDYLHVGFSAPGLFSDVKTVPPSDISELYRDKNAVIATLMVSHKETIEDYSYMSQEEMLVQQQEYYEECLLKKQTFGDLGFLGEQEYDDIYSITGIDVDNRRLLIHKYLSKTEKEVRGLVQFAKSIPGFSHLGSDVQTELIKLARPEFSILSRYTTVNLKLGITLGLTGENWACDYELGTDDAQSAVADYMIFCDKLQKITPTKEEMVLLKAILVVSTDRDNSVNSPLAEVIQWQLFQCLDHSLKKNREQPSLFLARYIMTLTQSRTVCESVKVFLRQMKLRKYSSIEKNPLLWEMYSWILQEDRDDNREQRRQIEVEEKIGLKFLWLMGCPLVL